MACVVDGSLRRDAGVTGVEDSVEGSIGVKGGGVIHLSGNSPFVVNRQEDTSVAWSSSSFLVS
jgi:hypothetical protein